MADETPSVRLQYGMPLAAIMGVDNATSDLRRILVANGRVLVDAAGVAPIDSTVPSYSSSIVMVPANNATDVFGLEVPALGPVVRIRRAWAWANTSGATNVFASWAWILRSAFDDPAGSTLQTPLPWDRTDAVAASVVRSYNAVLPVALGAIIGNLRDHVFGVPSAAFAGGPAALGGPGAVWEWPVEGLTRCPTLRPGEAVYLNLKGLAGTNTFAMSVGLDWTESAS